MQKVLYAIAGVFVALILIGLALPGKVVVSASDRIDAYPATVFALVNEPDRFALWSPWLDADPNARVVFAGPERGVDAAMTWDGPIIGMGSQVVAQSEPFSYVEYAINPGVEGHARAWFDLEDASGATVVTWSHESDYGFNLVARFFAPLLSGVVRRDYVRGLENLRELAETLPYVDFRDLEIERLLVDAMRIAYLSTTSRPEPAAMSEAMGDAYFDILNFIDTAGLEEAGAPLSITRSFRGADLLFDAAIPIRGDIDSAAGSETGVRIGQTYAGTVIRVRHIGSYRTLATTHRKIAAYLAALGIDRNGDPWESYVSDPTQVAESELLTYVYYPIRP